MRLFPPKPIEAFGTGVDDAKVILLFQIHGFNLIFYSLSLLQKVGKSAFD